MKSNPKQWNRIPILIAVLVVCIFSSVLQAQEAESLDDYVNRKYERVYVPESALAEYWSRVEPGVLLDRQEFQLLLEQTRNSSENLTGAPQGLVMESAQYQLELGTDLLRVVISCQVSKKQPGWIRQELQFPAGNLLSAKLGDQPAPLGRIPDSDKLALVTNFVGEQTLQLVITTPLKRNGTDELATVSLLPNVAGSVSAPIAAGRHLLVNGADLEERPHPQNARTLTFPAGGAGTLQLRWTDTSTTSAEESLVFAQTVYAIGMERDSLAWQTMTQIDLYGKQFTQLQFSVPQYLEITQVQ
ncbi:MAG: hypothetical protein KDA78_01430, partial [Planctomycetaceae bacterium]|nr:hypothetical protein [Planctomycetaceae bacterium]